MPKSAKTSRAVADALKRYVAPFRSDGTRPFRLKSHRTDEKDDLDKAAATEIIEANRQRLQDLQQRLYATDRWSVLLIFQGMDAAGKDTAIDSVFSGVNPQGVDVTSFKVPSTLELNHDFLWRATLRLPERGRLGIFNRSYYEECLVVRVHPQVLAKEKIPSSLVTANIWRERFEDINAYERYLSRNGTLVLKFFLNVSKEEQRRRFLDRLEEPGKRWKFSMDDVHERKLWDKYQAAYQDMIAHTSTSVAPWHVVPADHKWFGRVVIGSTIVSALEKLDLHFPKVNKAELPEYARVRLALEAEGQPGKAEKAARPKSGGKAKPKSKTGAKAKTRAARRGA
jgi:PPK2 family polyphosphate:nucleotide phosphotransferase